MNSLSTPRLTGRPRVWARDMALMGGLSSALVPTLLVVFVPWPYPLIAGALGLGSGAVLGAGMPAFLNWVRRFAPPWGLLLASPFLGLVWGGGTGALAGLAFGTNAAMLGLVAGGIAGAVQLTLWWFPYTFQTVRGARTWPVTLASVVALPLTAILVLCGALATM